MKTKQIIQSIFHEDPIKIETIPTGLTNRVYKVTLRDSSIVLRIPKEENIHLFDYPFEHSILDQVQSLDAPMLYYNEESGIKASLYIEDAHTFSLPYIKRAAILIKSLHELKIPADKDFDIIESFHSFESENSYYDLKPYYHVLEEAVNASSNTILCHNDLVEGNFLFSKDRDYLIDYEYAKGNDPYFDIMSFITENDIQNKDHRNEFYLEYFGHLPNKDMSRKLLIFEKAHHVLWCQWACLMYNLHGESVYKDIADLKYKRLMELM